MIKVLFNDYTLDLSNIGVKLIEKNNMFRDQNTKNFSFPFSLDVTEEISRAFNLPTTDNIVNYNTRIDVYVVENSTFHTGYIIISRIVDKKASMTLYYGHETLGVYSKNLNELPFEIVNTTSIANYARQQISRAWPDATHNYIKVRDTDFGNNSNYEYFEGFLNNYDGSAFIQNNNIDVEGETVAANYNAMVPMPYLMEILKVGYNLENKIMKGTFVEDAFARKICFIPEKHLEKFSASQFSVFSFGIPTIDYVASGKIISEYSEIFATVANGTYKLDISLSLDEVQAEHLDFKVKLGNVTLLDVTSENSPVHISETLNITIDDSNNNDKVYVVLKLNQQTDSIAEFNLIKYEYQEAKLNLFADSFSLADFMPDMNFRAFENAISNLFNLDVRIEENVVYIDYIDDVMPHVIFEDLSGQETAAPIRDVNSEKVFVLEYDNDESITVGRNGIVYSTENILDSDKTTIPIPVIPLEVEEDLGVVTAKNTSETTTLKLALYNGLVNSEPLAPKNIDGRSLKITDSYLKWQKWLKFRTNSEIIEHSFFAHASKTFSIKKGMFKFNKNHLIREIQKQSVNKKYNKVTIKSETL